MSVHSRSVADEDQLAWLVAVISGRQPGWPFDASITPADIVSAAHEQGVITLVDWRLQKHKLEPEPGILPVPSEVVSAFAVAARNQVLISMQLEAESRRVLGLMAQEGMPGLLLKGSALAFWAYQAPHLRACGDVDFLLASREAAEVLAARLVANGHERSETSGDLVAYELMCWRRISADWQLEVDVHWRLSNSPLFSECFTFGELLAESIPLPTLPPNALGLGAVHACIHACIHRALNLSTGVGDKLKWLYDLELLSAAFLPADWQKLQAVAIDKRLAGVVLNALQTAAAVFGRAMPLEVQQALLRAQAFEPLDAGRLAEWYYMQRKTCAALPGTGLKWRWLWQRLFPSRDYLRYLYGRHGSYARLMAVRIGRVLQRFR